MIGGFRRKVINSYQNRSIMYTNTPHRKLKRTHIALDVSWLNEREAG